MDGDLGKRQDAHHELVLLDRIHAAEARAERVVHGLVARAGAEDVGDPFGDLAVAGSKNRGERPSRCQEPVHLHPGDHILVPAEAVLRFGVGGEELVTGRYDHCADADLFDALSHLEMNRV